MIELETLTRGVVVARDPAYAGLWSSDEELRRRLDGAAGERSGERPWRLPLDPGYAESMRSSIADVVNSAADRGGHPVMGATFLTQFVPERAP